MDNDQYDEFGNYIAPNMFSGTKGSTSPHLSDKMNEEEDNPIIKEEKDEIPDESQELRVINPQSEIILNEDKKYYPTLEEVYPKADIVVMEEDTQPISIPMIAKPKVKHIDHEDSSRVKSIDNSFEEMIRSKQELIRNVCFIGHLHHGKTTLLDMFVMHSLRKTLVSKEKKYTDSRFDERDRQMTIKMSPLNFILQDSRGKSFYFNFLDCPGHPDFLDEMSAAIRISDGCVLVIDALEGMMMGTEIALKEALKEGLPIIIVINKIDRLIVELRFPPNDSYHKIKQILMDLNSKLEVYGGKENYISFSPANHNVIFAAGEYNLMFSVDSFARIYLKMHNVKISEENMTKLLWGDIYYNPISRKFQKNSSKESPQRTFVDFILDPLYKIIGHSISEEKKDLEIFLKKLGIYLNNADYNKDSKTLLTLILQKIFGDINSLVDSIVKHVPDSKMSGIAKLSKYYLGDLSSPSFIQVSESNKDGPLFLQIVKLYHKPNCLSFDAFGRVFSGTIQKGQNIKILGEKYTPENPEDHDIKEITNLWIFSTRFRDAITKAYPGNLVLIEGVDSFITKTATIVGENENNLCIMRPLKFPTAAVIKIACEPLVPSELPKMLEGLRKINKSYTACQVKVEESGEHLIQGNGELYMDNIFYDLRLNYAEIEIKVSDPSVSFCETIIDTSSFKCFANTTNKKNKVYMIAEPLDKDIARDFESENIKINWNISQTSKYLQKKYNWDNLTTNSLWGSGSDNNYCNILIDYTLPSIVDRNLLESIKPYMIQGFQWAAREGPLCEEPIKNTKFKILEADLSTDPVYRAAGQIIPAVRRVCNSAFLTANPKIMEPIYRCEIICTQECIPPIHNLLLRRRGHANSEDPVPGTPLYRLMADIPALDMFGFETDVRSHTSGQAFVLSIFDHWEVVPGDPLDKTIKLKLLEPSDPVHLSREILIKTRRRKGLVEDISISKFFDDPELFELIKQEPSFKSYF